MSADHRVKIVNLLARQQPADIVGLPESQWVDFKSAGPKGPYDLSLEAKKYELAKDVAAFANAGGGLLVCGFKATRRSTDLHEAVVRPMPFAKRLINTERYKGIINEYVRPLIDVEFHWYDDPAQPELGYLVIDVQALPESGRWALVTKTLSDKEGLVKGGIAVPIRHGDQTEYLPPDEVYRLLNSGLRGEPSLEVDLAVASGSAVGMEIVEETIDALVRKRRRELLACLPAEERASRRHGDDFGLLGSKGRAAEELARLGALPASLPEILSRDLRSPQQYREEVDEYLVRCRPGILPVLAQAVALQRTPLTLQVVNNSEAMLHQVEVIMAVEGGYHVIVDAPASAPDLGRLPWPEPPIPYGEKNPLATSVFPGQLPAPGGYRPGRWPSPAPVLPTWVDSEDGLVITFPPVDVRARATVHLPPITLYSPRGSEAAASCRWTATCTNLSGREKKVLGIPVEQLQVTIPAGPEDVEPVVE
ncbi:ATP-binding protein [Streptomyces pseudogriseolus]|uniref:AlbA family DNA-binding domain-containing protein n=1 Tax=Streptomyces pseudogriseolus TaxID=36817 RepID=UPI00348AD579